MSNYLRGELYRILKKKSLYILLLVSAVGFFALNYMILPANATSDIYLQPTGMLLNFLPMIFGIYIYITVFNDDFNNNVINSSVGFGIKRYKLVIYKLILTFLLTLIIILVLTGVFFLVAMFFKITFELEDIKTLLLLTLKTMVSIIGYASISSILLFSTKKALYGIIAYILLSTGAVNMLANMILSSKHVIDLIGDRSNLLFTSLTDGIFTLDYMSLIGIGIYFVVSVVVSIIMFRKVELEFN